MTKRNKIRFYNLYNWTLLDPECWDKPRNIHKNQETYIQTCTNDLQITPIVLSFYINSYFYKYFLKEPFNAAACIK